MKTLPSAKLWYSLIGLLWLSRAAAQTSSASFVYPPPRSPGSESIWRIINVFDTMIIEWESNYDNAFLYLWCMETPSLGYAWYAEPVDSTGNISFSPSLQTDTSRNWTIPYACHFDLLYTERPNRGQQGPFFNLTSVRGQAATTFAREFTSVEVSTTSGADATGVSIASSSSIVSQTASETGSSQTSLSGPTPTSPTPTSPTASAPSPRMNTGSGLSAGAWAGIAIGVVSGVVAMVAFGYLFYQNHRKLNDIEARIPGQDRMDDGKDAPVMIHELPHVVRVELDNTQQASELAS